MSLDLSIVIVNWNTRDLLRDCLTSVPDAVGDLSTEIIVVDNLSADDSVQMIKSEFPDCRLIQSGGNLGFSKGNNLALTEALGDTVLLLNPDTVCPPDSLAKLHTFLQTKPDAAAVGPLLLDKDGNPTITWGRFPRPSFHWAGFLDPRQQWLPKHLSERQTVIPSRTDKSTEVEYMMGACLMIPRQALEQIGPLDDRFFMYFEETDWCYRAHQASLQIWYCADSEITHLEGQSAAQASQFSILQFQKSYRLFIAKNYPGNFLPFRIAQFAEYTTKAFFNSLSSSPNSKAASTTFWQKAKLQLTGEITIRPPGER